MKSVVVTGVSSGIGFATAAELLKRGYRVYGSVRTEADADRLASQLGDGFEVLRFDVTDPSAVTGAAERVGGELAGESLSGLVNNAGVVFAGPLMHQPLDEIRRQMEVNFIGQVAVTQAFLPWLGARPQAPRPPGRIVNLSSLGGRLPLPFLGAYAASKHALEGFSDALRRELLIYGVDVVVIEPGSVQSAIWDKTQEIDLSRYEKTGWGESLERFRNDFVAQGRTGLPAEKVARTIRHALEVPSPRTRYALPPHPISEWLIPKMLPDRWLDRLMARIAGLRPLR